MITLYDLASNLSPQAWSPNTWKTRLNLNVAGLPYKTIYIEYPDIAELYRELKIEGKYKLPDGTSKCTLPVIYDDATGLAVADSFDIAMYLDKHYPSSQRTIPRGAETLHAAFADAITQTMLPLKTFTYPPTMAILNDRSREWFAQNRLMSHFGTSDLGKINGDLVGEEGKKAWTKVVVALHTIEGWLRRNDDGPYVMGKHLSFADLALVAFFNWCRTVWGAQSQMWSNLIGGHNGRFARYLALFEKYQQVEGTDSYDVKVL
ncbi:hypothetical protein CC1G_01486 [Coprinopsis cinerea okayama7|uniref:GST N-terminal domain-containing protein n=1 Tax=Coprinopsis cinerea (strain Okayama-7 / 130 / ATCC MYA-4618 / FGSC 9003) TaxID=240176 RepID=A8NHR4_COPC7|nr:hypothetical protein CC1G_01486 [Coprinopsis cinerea okayama7\|eukprot:XP_001833809.1 hypothetical protein CC1G_01486 [Coprinopsis cinerea okayama7\